MDFDHPVSVLYPEHLTSSLPLPPGFPCIRPPYTGEIFVFSGFQAVASISTAISSTEGISTSASAVKVSS